MPLTISMRSDTVSECAPALTTLILIAASKDGRADEPFVEAASISSVISSKLGTSSSSDLEQEVSVEPVGLLVLFGCDLAVFPLLLGGREVEADWLARTNLLFLLL
jgi:hypothetical protein